MAQRHTKALLLVALIIFIAIPATALVPPGRISVYSMPPGALACIDSRYCDTTGASFTVDGNSWHTVVVTERGYLEWTENVYVTSDQTSMVNAYLDLDRNATGIQVYLTPGGGTVCLDNSDCRANVGTPGSIGSTRFSGVSPGYHTVSVEAPADFEDTTELVQVSLGKITDVRIALNPFVTAPAPAATPASRPTGTVRVYVDRTGSTICIDDVDCFVNVGGTPGPGTGTVVFNEVRSDRKHNITVTAEGYKPVSTEITVTKDLITTVDVSLQPVTGQTPAPLPETTIPATTTLMPIPTRAGLACIPVIVALALCGAVLHFRKNNR
jgi:hypothetical protein